MMDGSFAPGMFVLIGIAMSIGWVINTWIRAKHGYPLDDGAGGKIEKSGAAETQRLLQVNRNLATRLENAEDRLAVLERIITDQGYDTARQIEALRDHAPAAQNQEKA